MKHEEIISLTTSKYVSFLEILFKMYISLIFMLLIKIYHTVSFCTFIDKVN